MPSESLSNQSLTNKFKPTGDLTKAHLDHRFPQDAANW